MNSGHDQRNWVLQQKSKNKQTKKPKHAIEKKKKKAKEKKEH